MGLSEGASRTLAVCRHEARGMRTELPFYASALLMPLAIMAFVKPVFRHALVAGEGYTAANGAEQAVPGMAVMSGFFMVGVVAYAFLREHGYGTWERLRATPARPWEIMAGKIGPFLVLALLQQLALFAAGRLLFGLHIAGSAVALGLVAMALSICLTALGVLLVALTSSMQQVNIVQTLGAMVFAGVGGALAPVSMLPTWIAAWAPAVPSYWAMRGYRAVILDGGGTGAVALPVVVLTAFTLAFLALAATRFRFEESRPYWL
jgi:ABC-2 type transport system permease protein